MQLTQIIRRPILTEKTNNIQGNNVYTFEVDWAANKFQIKQAVEFIFNVKVAAIRTLKMDKKAKRLGRFNGFLNRYKKAYVTLKEGFVINYYPEEAAAKEAEQAKAAQKAQAKAAEKEAAQAKEAALAEKLAAKKAKQDAQDTPAKDKAN
ncbi:50S ribosomal protein L23 [Mycoplasmopsis columbinasalis]|uniref:Large ribosomal subunit protein uL23 n=1 Tax=Mycoplasmopsis columbinasalis TaxID=114880 RepID=A0A449BA60_9BACT|nr:50S ribosomal protein L23 [Mycoplasmopsis columbinasalis]VEU78045.1 50S ribosomal protein L23 [Mycoplasmopsis columbinasalis]